MAQQLAVSKTAIHYHFKTKNDLGLAVCDYLMHNLTEEFHSYQAKGVSEPMQFLRQRIGQIAADEICPITSLQSDFFEFSTELQAQISELTNLETDIFTQVIAEKYGAKQADYYTGIFLSLMKGSLFYQRTIPGDFLERALHFMTENLN